MLPTRGVPPGPRVCRQEQDASIFYVSLFTKTPQRHFPATSAAPLGRGVATMIITLISQAEGQVSDCPR